MFRVQEERLGCLLGAGDGGICQANGNRWQGLGPVDNLGAETGEGESGQAQGREDLGQCSTSPSAQGVGAEQAVLPASQASKGKLGAEVESVSPVLREYPGQQGRTEQDRRLSLTTFPGGQRKARGRPGRGKEKQAPGRRGRGRKAHRPSPGTQDWSRFPPQP